MTAVNDAAQILKKQDGIDHIYSFFVPKNYMPATDTVDVLITDSGGFYTEYGSNRSTKRAQNVALSIYKGSKNQKSLDFLEKSIVSAFENEDWKVIYSSPIMIDPDTYQKTKSLQFQKYTEK